MTTNSQPVPMLVLGDTRRAAVEKQLSAVIEKWADRWLPATTWHVRVTSVGDVGTAGIEAGTQRWRIQIGNYDHGCYAAMRQGFVAEALGLHAGSISESSGIAGPLAASVQNELVESLGNHLGSALGIGDVVAREEDAASRSGNGQERSLRHWLAASLQMNNGKSVGMLLLDPALLQKWLPPVRASSATESFVKRSLVIRQDIVALEAVLGDADVALEDLASMAVDDVIVLNQDLTAPARLVCNGAHVAQAHLGQVDDRIAVSVVGA